MKTALVLLLSLTAAPAAFPQQPSAKTPDAGQKQPGVVKKLGSVTWDPDAHKLIWVVQKGRLVNGEFEGGPEERYEISPDEATMATSSEKRGFGDDEAVTLHRLLNVLSLYCAESVAWWDQGQGTPVDPSEAPKNPKADPDHPAKPSNTPKQEKPVKVGELRQPRRP